MKHLFLCLLLAFSLEGFGRTYSTNFDATQNPISEGGNWLNGKTDGTDWADIATYSGVAHGVNTSGTYNDPTAVLNGTWAPNQTATAVVYSVSPTNSYYQEVELRLRSAISSHSCWGYEIFFRCLKTSEAYTQIVRWNGAYQSYDYIASQTGAQYGVTNGDTVKATISGDTIRAYINGVLKAQGRDPTFTTGNPGIGFNYGCDGTYGNFGFTSFTATDGITETEAIPEIPNVMMLAPGQNPFFLGTAIRYSLHRQGGVSLKVFDMLGRERIELVNGNQPAGTHSVHLSASGLAPGVYTLRLAAEGAVRSARIVVMK